MKITSCIVGMAIAVFVLVPSTSAGKHGRLKRNLEMEQSFKEGRPPAGYRYYARGRENLPDAIVGLEPEYRQTARFWREIDAETGDVETLSTRLATNYKRDAPRAFSILTPDGRVIGVYFSSIYSTTVAMESDNAVKIYKPKSPRAGP